MNNDNEKLIKIGKNIKRQRKLKGFTQEYVCLKANINVSYYGKVERGEKNISVLYLLLIAEVIGVDITSFFSFPIPPKNTNTISD